MGTKILSSLRQNKMPKMIMKKKRNHFIENRQQRKITLLSRVSILGKRLKNNRKL